MRRSNMSNQSLHITLEEDSGCADLHFLFLRSFRQHDAPTNSSSLHATMTPIEGRRLQETDLRLIGTCGECSERMESWQLQDETGQTGS